MKLILLAAVIVTVIRAQNVTGPEVATHATTTVAEEDDKLVITSIKIEPFLMERDGQLEGYVVDLVRHLARQVGFKYELRVVKDGMYGSMQEDGTYNGMIGEIIRQEADMAVAPLTITAEREFVVDFSMSFMSTGIIMVAAVRTVGQNLGMFLALQPFSIGVWFLLLVCFLIFGMSLFLLNLFNPNEWKQAFSRGKGSIKDARSFNIFGSLWFGLTTFSCQGYDKAPRSLASKVLVAFWFFFVLFTLILYTSSMISIVNNAKPEVDVAPYGNLYDMVESGQYKFTALNGGSTWQFFQNSRVPTYERIKAELEAVTDIDSGIEKAKSGKYGFLAESPIMQKYLNAKSCDLVKVADALDSKGYGIAMAKGSELKRQVNTALLRMREEGLLQNMYNKWWQKEATCPELPQAEDVYASQTGTGTVIDEYRYSGAVIILVIGIALSAVVALVEFLIYKRKTTPRQTKKEKLIDAEEGHALNDTQPTILESTRVDEVKEDEEKEEDQKKEKEDDVGEELEPEDKVEKDDIKDVEENDQKEEAKP